MICMSVSLVFGYGPFKDLLLPINESLMFCTNAVTDEAGRSLSFNTTDYNVLLAFYIGLQVN